jgi:hypothetical protein
MDCETTTCISVEYEVLLSQYCKKIDIHYKILSLYKIICSYYTLLILRKKGIFVFYTKMIYWDICLLTIFVYIVQFKLQKKQEIVYGNSTGACEGFYC